MAKPLSAQMKKAKQEQLRQKAEANTTVMKKTGREEPVAIKQGTPNDHSLKHDSHSAVKFGMSNFKPVVGANVGCTLNMENYESMRIDCWISDEVRDGESFEEAFARVLEIVQNQVEETASVYKHE